MNGMSKQQNSSSTISRRNNNNKWTTPQSLAHLRFSFVVLSRINSVRTPHMCLRALLLVHNYLVCRMLCGIESTAAATAATAAKAFPFLVPFTNRRRLKCGLHGAFAMLLATCALQPAPSIHNNTEYKIHKFEAHI